MTPFDTQRRREFIRQSVREKLEADGAVSRADVIDDLVTDLLAYEHDVEQMIRSEVASVYDRETRSRKDGMRRSEVTYNVDGLRVDVQPEQLTIPQFEEVAQRKRDHGLATVAESEADMAVIAEARRRCMVGKLDLNVTRACDVMTRDEIVAIRRGDEGTCLRVAA